MQWMGLMMICCGMAVKRVGCQECEEDEGTDCEDEDSDNEWYRQIESDMLCVLSVFNGKIIFLADIIFGDQFGEESLSPAGYHTLGHKAVPIPAPKH